ncbi:hypothetical protein AAC387_Pa06g1792 [Persea americana]
MQACFFCHNRAPQDSLPPIAAPGHGIPNTVMHYTWGRHHLASDLEWNTVVSHCPIRRPQVHYQRKSLETSTHSSSVSS